VVVSSGSFGGRSETNFPIFTTSGFVAGAIYAASRLRFRNPKAKSDEYLTDRSVRNNGPTPAAVGVAIQRSDQGEGIRMFRKGLMQLRKAALPLAMAAVILTGTSIALSSKTAAATSASSSSGVWPGVGKICEPGPGGASSVRGVGDETINIAVFNDASNTIDPGLKVEFPQQATAFADWRNAAGASTGARS
jgi:predicted RecA/RadA family phage recombinase